VANVTHALTASEIIDGRPLSRFQIRTIVLCGVVLVLDGFDAQIIGFLAAPISETLKIPLKAFGPILSASLFGLMIAAMATGPIADRWGRKWTVVLSTITFALFALLTARVTTFNQLLILRFLTGLGLGGALPNVVSLATEYSPRRYQTVFVSVLFAGMPLGGVLGGVTSSALIPTWGWRSAFYVGGLLPLALACLLIAVLPESVRFLSVRSADPRKIAKVLAKISPDLTGVTIASSSSRAEGHQGLPVKHLFTEGRAAGTILLWIPFFMNLLLLYFVVSWMPALLRQAGMSVSAGITATTLFSVGGIVGCFVEGTLINVLGAFTVLVAEFALCAVFMGSLAFVAASLPVVFPLAFVVGFCVVGAQSGINALAAAFYPTAIRSTGIGWALGIGRIGSIVGPMVAGALLSAGWRPQQVFLAGVIPACCAAAAVMLASRLRGTVNAYRPEPGATAAQLRIPGRGAA
jgi:MFS transporter, AAHS family, 4-hydroxybenzoate transporter